MPLPLELGRPQLPAGPAGIPPFSTPARPQVETGPKGFPFPALRRPQVAGTGLESPLLYSSCNAVASAGGFDTARDDCRKRRWT
jgi:hypothetical protein